MISGPGEIGFHDDVATKLGLEKFVLIKEPNVMSLPLQGGFRQKHRHKNADSKIGPRGWKPGRKPQENDQKSEKPQKLRDPAPT
jgi:hypothetical protein